MSDYEIKANARERGWYDIKHLRSGLTIAWTKSKAEAKRAVRRYEAEDAAAKAAE